MECVRFGGTIPGEYWGCCCGGIFQNFNQDPDTPASIQLVDGDAAYPIQALNGELAFLGPTLRDIFWQRLRISTFGATDMPNQFFLAVLEQSQIDGSIGKKWLALLKEAGFEFIRTVDNSVYTGAQVGGEKPRWMSPHPNHIFGLFRNIGRGEIKNPFVPPKAWTNLPNVVPEAWAQINNGETLATEQRQKHTEIWNAHGPTKILGESEIVAAGAPVIMAGMRTEFPPELKKTREKKLEARKKANLPVCPSEGTQYLYHDKDEYDEYDECYEDCDCEYPF